MSVQTSYVDTYAVGFAGLRADAGDMEIMSMVSVEASAEIPFGVAVKFKATNTTDQDALLPTGGSDKIAGIVLFSDMYQRTYSLADGTTGGDLGTTGLKPGAMLNVLRRGRVWVKTEAACVPGDRMFIRVDNGEGSEQLGAISNAADESDMIDASTQGVFLTTAAIGGLAILEVDFTSKP